jgi:hypothetical protein
MLACFLSGAIVEPMNSPERVELRFERGAPAAEVQAVVDDVLAELRDPASESARLAREAGFEPADAAGAQVSVGEEGQGIEPTTTILVGIAASFGGEVAKTLWREVIWPRVRRKLGINAVGPERED